MMMYRIGCVVIVFLMLIGCEKSPRASYTESVETEKVSYHVDDQKMIGYLAYPSSIKGKEEGVLVVHEWWGQTEYPRKRARQLANMGYVAFAVDMYGHQTTTTHPNQASKFSQKVMSEASEVGKRFEAALKTFKKKAFVKEENIAAIGYCFGGSVVLEMARQGVDLDAVVSFHGGLNTPTKAKPGKVNARVLVLNGKKDPTVSKKTVRSFKKEMEKAKVDYELVQYEGAKHGFTNPQADKLGKKYDLPIAYHSEADRKSWKKMKNFLNETFK